MNATELLVIVGCAGLGYLAVWMFLGGSNRPPASSQGVPPLSRAADWHQVLEVSPEASMEDIRSAYRRLMSLYHPDKVASLGPDLQALANAKTLEIAEAYRQACQALGAAFP